MAMGEDSFSGGRWLDSQHRLLDGHFLHLFVVSLLYLFVKGKINKKRLEIANGWTFFAFICCKSVIFVC